MNDDRTRSSVFTSGRLAQIRIYFHSFIHTDNDDDDFFVLIEFSKFIEIFLWTRTFVRCESFFKFSILKITKFLKKKTN